MSYVNKELEESMESIESLRKENSLLRAKLKRIRDWLKYTANSDSGIVTEIDGLL